jgi:hypothetical protein
MIQKVKGLSRKGKKYMSTRKEREEARRESQQLK